MAFLLALCASPAAADRLKVCTIGLNTPDELDVFRARLPPGDFKLIDLTPRSAPASDTEAVRTGATPWLANECRNDLRCDVVVVSAEFGGRFFGTSQIVLGLEDMEAASCSPACDGLFHAPREVFLLGCNTLATKDPDRRSPAAYLQVLLDHGFDRTSAEHVVALRYGPLGSSFREALRRIFSGVPRIYGFSSVAPSGPHTSPMLEAYFDLKGDYRRYLEAEGRSPARNAQFFRAFRGASVVQVAGVTPQELSAGDRAEICKLYDDHRSVADRLRVVRGLLARDDFLAFLPSIEVFFAAHPSDRFRGDERAVFEDIRRQEHARNRVLRLVHDLDVSALRMELAYLAMQLQWMSHEELRRLAVDGAHELVGRPLTLQSVDIVCEIAKYEPVGDSFDAATLPDEWYRHAKGLRLIDCLAPPDRRVSVRLVETLEHEDNPNTRLWAVYALSGRLPLDDAILLRLAPHLADPSPELRDRLRRVFVGQAVRAKISDDVQRAVATYDSELVGEMKKARKSYRR